MYKVVHLPMNSNFILPSLVWVRPDHGLWAKEVGHGVTTHDNEVKVTGPTNLHAEVKWRLVYICMASIIQISLADFSVNC